LIGTGSIPDGSAFSFTPRLQPGGEGLQINRHRFNGFRKGLGQQPPPKRLKPFFDLNDAFVHRAEAAV
jgi:hypothetical protein